MIKFGNAGIMIILVLIITLCFVVFADTVNYSTDMGLLSSAIPDHITLTWVNNPVSTQAITWRTNSTIETGVVQYSKSHELALSKSVNAKKTNLVTDLGNENLFFSSITGLDPGTTYYYRVGDGLNNWSRISSFTTEKIDQDHVEFLVFGDSQSGDITILDYQPWNTTINHAFDAHPNANFFVQIGDSSES